MCLLYDMLMMSLHISVWQCGIYCMLMVHISSIFPAKVYQKQYRGFLKKISISMQLFALQDLSQSSILYCLKYEISFYKKTNNTIRSLQIDSFDLKIILFIASVMML